LLYLSKHRHYRWKVLTVVFFVFRFPISLPKLDVKDQNESVPTLMKRIMILEQNNQVLEQNNQVLEHTIQELTQTTQVLTQTTQVLVQMNQGSERTMENHTLPHAANYQNVDAEAEKSIERIQKIDMSDAARVDGSIGNPSDVEPTRAEINDFDLVGHNNPLGSVTMSLSSLESSISNLSQDEGKLDPLILERL